MPVIDVPGYGPTEFPDGMSDQDIVSAIQKNMVKSPKSDEQSKPMGGATGTWDSGSTSTWDKPSGFKRGLVDDTANSITQAMLGLTGWLAPDKAELIKQDINKQEQQYQSARGDNGIDWGRLGGQMLNPLNLGIAALTKTPPGASMLARGLSGAAGGSAMGATAPVYGDESRLDNTGLGALGGAVAAPVAGAMSRVIDPKVSQQVALLRKEGVTPTIGQSMGGAWQRLEDKAMSVPIVGDAISYARKKGMDQFQKAGYNRALNPIGQEAGKGVGFDGMQKVHNALSNEYKQLLPKLGWKADQQFASDAANLRSTLAQGSGIDPNDVAIYDSVVNKVMGMATPQGNMNGEMYKNAESELGREIVKLSKDNSYGKQTVKDALIQFRDQMKDNLSRSNPMYQKELEAINEGWANYAVLRRAASGAQAAQTGTFTPSQLMQGVQQSAKRSGQAVGQGKLSEGTALMQDLASAGYDVLPSKYPDSGTAGRLMLGAGGLASGALNPLIPASLVAGSLPYMPGITSGLDVLMNARPDKAKLLAELIRRNSTVAAPALPAVVNGFGQGNQ